jgi:hypothetical protein
VTENYDVADTNARYPNETTPSAQLTACLRRHRDLGLEILNIRDDLASRLHQDD